MEKEEALRKEMENLSEALGKSQGTWKSLLEEKTTWGEEKNRLLSQISQLQDQSSTLKEAARQAETRVTALVADVTAGEAVRAQVESELIALRQTVEEKAQVQAREQERHARRVRELEEQLRLREANAVQVENGHNEVLSRVEGDLRRLIQSVRNEVNAFHMACPYPESGSGGDSLTSESESSSLELGVTESDVLIKELNHVIQYAIKSAAEKTEADSRWTEAERHVASLREDLEATKKNLVEVESQVQASQRSQETMRQKLIQVAGEAADGSMPSEDLLNEVASATINLKNEARALARVLNVAKESGVHVAIEESSLPESELSCEVKEILVKLRDREEAAARLQKDLSRILRFVEEQEQEQGSERGEGDVMDRLTAVLRFRRDQWESKDAKIDQLEEEVETLKARLAAQEPKPTKAQKTLERKLAAFRDELTSLQERHREELEDLRQTHQLEMEELERALLEKHSPRESYEDRTKSLLEERERLLDLNSYQVKLIVDLAQYLSVVQGTIKEAFPHDQFLLPISLSSTSRLYLPERMSPEGSAVENGDSERSQPSQEEDEGGEEGESPQHELLRRQQEDSRNSLEVSSRRIHHSGSLLDFTFLEELGEGVPDGKAFRSCKDRLQGLSSQVQLSTSRLVAAVDSGHREGEDPEGPDRLCSVIWEADVHHLQGQLELVTEELKQERERKESLAVEHSRCQDVIRSHRDEERHLREHVKSVEKQQEALEELVDELRSKVEFLEREENQPKTVEEIHSTRMDWLTEVHDKAKELMNEKEIEALDRRMLLTRVHELEVMFEEVTSESERLREECHREVEDLRHQVEAADNQLKSVRRFLDEQAAEREQEREEYGKEIQCLMDALKGKDKSGTAEHDLHLEMERLNSQLKERHEKATQADKCIAELEKQLEASNDKMGILKERISALETQLEQKSESESILRRQIGDLEVALHQQEELLMQLEERDRSRVEADTSIAATESSECSSHGPAVHLQCLRDELRQQAGLCLFCPWVQGMGNESLGSTESLLSSTLLKERGEFMDPGLTEELKRLEEKLEFLAKAEESLLLKTREFEEQLRASRKREQELEGDRRELQRQVNAHLQTISDLQTALEEEKHGSLDPEELMERIALLTQELHSVRVIADSKERQLEQLRFDSEEAKKKLVSREEELNKLRGKGTCQLRHWVAEDDRRLEELRAENQTLGERLGALQEDVKKIPIHILSHYLEGDATDPFSSLLNQSSQDGCVEVEVLRKDPRQTSSLSAILPPSSFRVHFQPEDFSSKGSSRLRTPIEGEDPVFLTPDSVERSRSPEADGPDEPGRHDISFEEALLEREQEIKDLQKIIEEKTLSLERKSFELQELSQECDDLRAEADTARQEGHRIQAALDDVCATLDEERGARWKKEEELKGKEVELDELRRNLAGMQDLLKRKEAEYQDLMDEQRDLESREVLAKQVREWKSQVEVLTKQQGDLERKHRDALLRLKDELEAVRGSVKVKDEEISALKKHFTDQHQLDLHEIPTVEALARRIRDEVKHSELLDRRLFHHLKKPGGGRGDEETETSSTDDDASVSHRVQSLLSKVHKEGLQVLNLSEQARRGGGDVADVSATLQNLLTRFAQREQGYKKQVEVLEYKVQQEKILSNDLKATLDLEKQRGLDLLTKVSSERVRVASLDAEKDSLCSQLEQWKLRADRDQAQIYTLSREVETMQHQSRKLESALRVERGNFAQLTEMLDKERSLFQVTSLRDKKFIQELREKLSKKQEDFCSVLRKLDSKKEVAVPTSDSHLVESLTEELTVARVQLLKAEESARERERLREEREQLVRDVERLRDALRLKDRELQGVLERQVRSRVMGGGTSGGGGASRVLFVQEEEDAERVRWNIPLMSLVTTSSEYPATLVSAVGTSAWAGGGVEVTRRGGVPSGG
ncbi:unnamed protein product [Darwinula stevensoni]|uniref:Uncharacterized protein n=1 Tax=Darwinula stevensoni TaxID=69355 RepID=A0A7R8XCU1_9CRUS|nr:unnamed protein product [Darwinula stevensoni]CAG0888077.1 unnamed protein product [Darwinula stevensoni]